jgi:sugar lactone lactonase YvrE
MKPFYLLIIVSSFIAGCKKDAKQPDAPSGPPVITSINPLHGPKNALDTIIGSGFSSTAAANVVSFNGKPALVVNAGADRLIVSVPERAGDGEVVVTVNGKTARGPQFRYEAFSITVFAGAGYAGWTDGTGTHASMATPVNIAPDSAGNLYVVEVGNNIVRKITTPGAVVSRFAGVIGKQGTTDGPGLTAMFKYAYTVCTDPLGNVYIGDVDAYNIRKITPDGSVSVYAARAVSPTGLTMDGKGTLLCVGPFSDALQRINSAGQLDEVTMNSIGTLWGITLDAKGNIIVSDQQYHVIRKVMPDGSSTIIAGVFLKAGAIDGKADTALFNTPKALATDKNGNIYVADQGNNAIRKISTDGIVTTLISNISKYTLDGGGAFSGAWGLCVDKSNILYIANTGESTILKVVFD